MKRLKFKKPFNGMDKALKLIPESYKTDGHEFEMTDGNETYRVKWETELNEATVLTSANKSLINEDMDKIKHLMGFKSQDTLGTLKGSERIDENTKFGDIMGKTKSLLSESEDKGEGEETEAINEMTGGYGFTGEGNLEGMDEMKMGEEEVVEEGELADVQALGDAMSNSPQVQAAAKKINSVDEKVAAAVAYVNEVTGGDEALNNKIARQLMNEEEAVDTSMTNEEVVAEELDNPEKADLDKDGEISSYEEKRGEAIEKAVEKDRFDEVFDGFDNDADESDSIVEDDVEEVE